MINTVLTLLKHRLLNLFIVCNLFYLSLITIGILDYRVYLFVLIYTIIYALPILLCLSLVSYLLCNFDSFSKIRFLIKSKNTVKFCFNLVIVLAIVWWTYRLFKYPEKADSFGQIIVNIYFLVICIVFIYLDLHIDKIDTYNRYLKSKMYRTTLYMKSLI